jgi:twinkle protein
MKTITLADIDRFAEEYREKDESAFVRPASSYLDEVLARFNGTEVKQFSKSLPWAKGIGNFDIRRSEVTLWLGYNGHGKSLVLGQIVNRLMQQGDKVCIASFEMRPAATLQRMCRQAAGSRDPSIPYIRAYHAWTDNRLWIYDQHGSTPPDRVVNLCRYAASMGINHVLVDSLMKVVEAEDDYNGQKRFVNQLCVLARDTGLHIHLVHHSRKGADESKIPGKMDAKGSGAISDLVDNVASVWRRKDPDDQKPDCLISIDKQRHGEWEGKIGLWFHADSQSFCESDHRMVHAIPLEVEEEYSHEF